MLLVAIAFVVSTGLLLQNISRENYPDVRPPRITAPVANIARWDAAIAASFTQCIWTKITVPELAPRGLYRGTTLSALPPF